MQHDDGQERPITGEPISVGEWLGGAVLFLAGWFFTRTYHPEDERHFLKCGIAILLCLILYGVARKFLSDAKLTGVLALAVALAFLLLFVIPHHALPEHSPKTPVGKALFMAINGFAILVWFLAIVSVYVAIRGGGKRWRWFVERFPLLAEFTGGLSEGIAPLLLILTLGELVWRLTA